MANQGLRKNKIGRLVTRNLEVRYGPLKTSKEYKNILIPINVYQWTVTMNEALKNEMEHMNYPVTVSHPGAFSMGLFTEKILTVGTGVIYQLNKRYFLSQADLPTAIVLNLPKIKANVSLPILIYFLGVLTGHSVTH